MRQFFVSAVQVYLYVSASKRVVGCVMLQSIQSACHAIPAEDAAASTGDSSACKPLSGAPLSALLQPTGRPVAAGLPAQTRKNLPLRSGIFPSAGVAVSNTQVRFQVNALHHGKLHSMCNSNGMLIGTVQWLDCIGPAG